MDTYPQLNIEKVLKLLDDQGPISRYLPGYETRAEQREMMKNVLEAFNHNQIALIEAGTGTGKSMAYLIPAMIAASLFKEKIVISTNTIALQEQLIHKDIPLIANALDLSLKTVLVKGMNNYLCLRKLDEVQFEMLLLPEKDREELQKIDAAREAGSRSNLKFNPSPHVWELVGAEHDLCTHVECPHYHQCPYLQARKQANDASILVVNHHLLFADLAMRAEMQNYSAQAVLPPYKRLVLDEAHNIEDIATEYFANHLGRFELLRLLGRLSTDKVGHRSGKLMQLKERLHAFFVKNPSKEGSQLFQFLSTEVPAIRRELQKTLNDAFLCFHQFMTNCLRDHETLEEGKLRLLPHHFTTSDWEQKVRPLAKELSEKLKLYVQALSSIENKIQWHQDDKLNEQTKSLCFDIKALTLRLEEMESLLIDFVDSGHHPSKVKWIEVDALRSGTNITLKNAQLDISQLLVQRLFDKFDTIILSSATLTSNQQFHFLRSRLGLHSPFSENREVTENIYASPFNYSKQALLLVPQDLPDPASPQFLKESAHFILQAIEASKGNAFVLFTSYQMLQSCASALGASLKKRQFHLLKQGDESRNQLIAKFKTHPRSVLFGTDSFWEGVDVAGDALQCVIIVKLPFKVPSDPLLQARAEDLSSKGVNPFLNYFLPQAIVKFKQGFGRLIRNKKDRGCIVCLDNRLINKNYGKIFLNSLPECRQIFAPRPLIEKYMIDFYKSGKTHPL
ncbi:MAG: ATP-dependent DNA helicase [Parachlamydiaceae bacterium]